MATIFYSRCSFCFRHNSSSSITIRRTKPKSHVVNCSIENKNNSKPNLITSVSKFVSGLRNRDELGLEIMSIAVPAALALAADPIASLVDSAFVGHVGSVELAAVGVSISVFNLVSKLFNVPLLNITTSFVAEEQALANTSYQGFDDASVLQGPVSNSKKIFPAVSTSLALAAGIGIAEAIALSFGSGFLMNIIGISVDSPMRLPAEHFLALRAFGAPAIVIALAAQGTFRGFMDTKTPLYATVIGNLLNAILDPVLIFLFGLGIGGAAISTVISEYLIAVILLWELNSKVLFVLPKVYGKGIVQYLKSGGLLIGRTIAVLFTMTLATSMAARQGPIQMAAHQICMEVWLAVSLLNDALALSGQALLASGYSQKNYTRAQDVIYKVLQIGLLTGVALAIILFLGFDTFSRTFTSDTAVLDITRTGVLFVAGSQPMTAVAFVLDGLYYGVSDFAFAAYSMVLVGVITSLFLFVAAPVYGLAGVWMGLFLFMTLRVVAGVWRLGSRSGPWEMVWSENENK
ncbi:Protein DETOXIFICATION 44 [Ranunculus cassubicifolius]